MQSNTFSSFTSRSLVAVHVVALSCALATLAHAAPQSSQTATPTSRPAQTSFATPKQAADDLQVGVQDGFRGKRELPKPGSERQKRDSAENSEKTPKAPTPRPNLIQHTHRSPS